MKRKFRRVYSTVDLCYIGVMTAIAVVLSIIFKIPMSFLAPWLKLDFSFVPMLLTGFALGPVPGIIVLFITNIIHLFISNSGMVGQLADVIFGICFLLPSVITYKIKHDRMGALMGMIAGSVLLIIAGFVVNYYVLLPLYFGAGFADKLANYGFSSVTNLMLVAVLPYNVIKGVLTTLLTFILYKNLSKLLRKLERKEQKKA